MIEQDSIKNFMWESAKETFETMIFLPIERADGDGDKLDPSVSVICTITFTGLIQGVFAIRSSATTVEKIGRAMLMSGPDDPMSDAEVYDALGEVTNMIVGGVKGKMVEAVGEISISIPSVIKGVEIRPAMGRNAETVDLDTKVDGETVKLIMMYKSES